MRRWHEAVADLADGVPGGVLTLALLLLMLTGLVAAMWYWFPEWWRALMRTLRRLVRSLVEWRRTHREQAATPEPVDISEPEPAPAPEPAADHLPAVAAEALLLSADELAAQGRFAEAVRERLRAIVRDLVDRGVVEHRPGWTVTELAASAGAVRPDLLAPLIAASDIFSAVWYGQRTATAAHDTRMRQHAAAVRDVLDRSRVPA